jgi:hypothetical protein
VGYPSAKARNQFRRPQQKRSTVYHRNPPTDTVRPANDDEHLVDGVEHPVGHGLLRLAILALQPRPWVGEARVKLIRSTAMQRFGAQMAPDERYR